jgi:hypothetical protein
VNSAAAAQVPSQQQLSLSSELPVARPVLALEGFRVAGAARPDLDSLLAERRPLPPVAKLAGDGQGFSEE